MTRLLLTLTLACLLLAACDKSGDSTAAAIEPATNESGPPTLEETTRGPADESPVKPAVASGASSTAAPPNLPDASQLGSTQARLQQAERLLGEMAKAYQEAPALTDTVTVQAWLGGTQTPDETSVLRMGNGADLYLKTKSNEITCIDGVVFLTMNTAPDRFLKMALLNDVLATLRKEFGSYGGVMIQPALRYGKSRAELIFNLALGMPEEPRISGYRVIKDLQDRTLEQISLSSASGSATVNVDPTTKFIVSADVDFLPPNSPLSTFRIKRHLEFTPVRHEVLPEPIEFDPTNKIAVRETSELLQGVGGGTIERLAFSQGDPAPDFELTSFVGEKFKLSENRDSVVVVVFWASWSVASRAGLPQVNRFTAWAEASGKPIKVVAINTMRKSIEKTEQWQRVYDLWQREELKMIGLIDDELEVTKRYQVDGVPITLVIGTDGNVFRINSELNDQTPQLLQDQCLEALRTGG